MKIFLKGKKMWDYIIDTLSNPKNEEDKKKYVEQLYIWEVNESKIIIWTNNSIENSIGTWLVNFETVKEIWDNLEILYTQSNFAK